MPRFTAPLLFVDGTFHTGLAVVTRPDGLIASIEPAGDDAEFFEGILCAGLVNAHCHLELSHLKGTIPTGTGMAAFARAIVTTRNQFSEAEMVQAAQQAATGMLERGIAATGDISNQAFTAPIKQEMRHEGLAFHTFIELLGSRPEKADEIMQAGERLLASFGPRTASLTAHAPYSVSLPLLERIGDAARHSPHPISLHLMESEEEMQLFASHSGPLLELLQGMGLAFAGADWEQPLDYLAAGLGRLNNSCLLVHNTRMSEAHIHHAINLFPQAWFVLCPNANQYIHGSLPPAPAFHALATDRVCLGTDSLAGNHALDLVSEMRSLQSAFPALSTEVLLTWATVNGAAALGLASSHGALIPGQKPGLTLISGVNTESGKFTAEAASRRLI